VKDKLDKLGLFGGSFDPIHQGHIKLAQKALELFDLDRIDFIPAKQSPHKDHAPSLDKDTRIQKIKEAIKDFDQFALNTMELEQDHISYSIDTAKKYKKQYPETNLYFLMGCDNWFKIETWNSINELAQIVTFIVFNRDQKLQEKDKKGMQVYFVDDFDEKISSSELRNNTFGGV